MGNQHQGRALFVIKCHQQIGHLMAGLHIQISGRFIGKKNARIDGKGTGNRHPLLFTAGELARCVQQTLGQAHTIEDFPGLGLGVVDAAEFQWQQYILQCRQRRQQLKGLKNEPDPVGAMQRSGIFVPFADGLAREFNGSGSWNIKTGQKAQQRCLAGARLANNCHGFTGLDAEVDILQDSERGIGDGYLMIQIRCPNHHRIIILQRSASGWKWESRNLMQTARNLTPVSNTRKTLIGSIRTLLITVLLLVIPLPMVAAEKTLVVLGDSLSAGYGIAEEDGWVHKLQQRLSEEFPQWRVVNASTSGDTTDGGLRRIDRVLADHEPELMIIQLGGNDGLRGFNVGDIRANLSRMVEKSLEADARVLLLGIELPPNYGGRYTRAFREVFGEVASEYDVEILPFLLEGVYDREGMMQSDRIHPTADAQAVILDNVWEVLGPMLEE